MLLRKFPKNKINLFNFVFEVTSKCNQNCIYCYNVWKYRKYPVGQIDLNSWKKIVLKLKEETKVENISISGGEPLLYSEVFELVNFIKKQKINVNFLTNGSLINEYVAKKLVNDVSLFEISLVASDRRGHKKLKGVDDFDKVLEGIVNLTQLNGKVIAVFVATNRNIHLLKDTLDLARMCMS